jgi:hypothetical protein
MTRISRATARDVARALPAADEARVRDVLAAAGADPMQALAVLATAIGTIAGRRVDLPVQLALLGGVVRLMANTALLHAQDAAGRG